MYPNPRKTYRLVISFPMNNYDDPEAREQAKTVLRQVLSDVICPTPEIKLQEIFPDKPPRKVEL